VLAGAPEQSQIRLRRISYRCRIDHAEILHESVSLSDVSEVEGTQALGALVSAIEEAAVDAVVALARPLVGPLDRELAVRQRLAGHLDATETARLEHRRKLDLGRVDAAHAADVLL